ncbi:MAG: hypothetical protein M1816_004705 [Peltula sp. TS41687]|nr:MAG: hypothetical protein M1816_004705 [Peltula sp. TS41687]
MADHYLLQAIAKVTGPDGLELVERALENSHDSRYTFRRCGEQLTRELADGWEGLRATMQRAEGVFEALRPTSSIALQQSLRQEIRRASRLLAEVVAIFASRIPTTFSNTRDQRRRVDSYEVCQRHQGNEHFFREVHRNERSTRLVSEMKAALHKIDLSLASASLYEMKTFLSIESEEQKFAEEGIERPEIVCLSPVWGRLCYGYALSTPL